MKTTYRLRELNADNTAGTVLGILSPVRNDEILEQLNGKYELTFQYPASGSLFGQLQPGRLVEYIHSASLFGISDGELFYITRMSKVINGWVTVYCSHISWLLRRAAIGYIYATSAAMAVGMMKDNIVGGTPFSFETELETEAAMRTDRPMPVNVFMGSGDGCILDIYGGEWVLSGYTCELVAERGVDRRMKIIYGYNMTDIQADYEISGVRDGIYAYWTIDLPGVQLPASFYELVMRDGAEATPGSWIEPVDYSAAVKEATENYTKLDVDDIAVVRAAALADLEKETADLIAVAGSSSAKWIRSIKVSFELLSRAEEYKNADLPEMITLGDPVEVYFPQAGVSETLRVTEIRYQPSADRYKSVVLGRKRKTVVNTILRK